MQLSRSTLPTNATQSTSPRIGKQVSVRTSGVLKPITLQYANLHVGKQSCLAPLYQFNDSYPAEHTFRAHETFEVIDSCAAMGLISSDNIKSLFDRYQQGDAIDGEHVCHIATENFSDTCSQYKIDIRSFAKKYKVTLTDFCFEVDFDVVRDDMDTRQDGGDAIELLLHPESDFVQVFFFDLEALPSDIHQIVKSIVYQLQLNADIGSVHSNPCTRFDWYVDDTTDVEPVLNDLLALPEIEESNWEFHLDVIRRHKFLDEAFSEIYYEEVIFESVAEFIPNAIDFLTYMKFTKAHYFDIGNMRQQLQELDSELRCQYKTLINCISMTLEIMTIHDTKLNHTLKSGITDYSDGLMVGFGDQHLIEDMVNPMYHQMQQTNELPFIVAQTDSALFYECLARMQLALTLIGTLETTVGESI